MAPRQHRAHGTVPRAAPPLALSPSPALSPSSLSSQVFIATDKCRTHAAYSRAMAALLQRLDAFTSAAAMAQALPVLHGRSYLDIASMQCKEEPGRSRGQGGDKGAGTGLALMPPWWLSLSQTR